MVRDNPVPLCSDAFWERSNFQSMEEAEQNNRDVRNATNRLLDDVISRFADDLNSHRVQLSNHYQLIQILHERGINVKKKKNLFQNSHHYQIFQGKISWSFKKKN